MTLISYAGVNFNTGGPDADGCVWTMRVPEGWGSRPIQLDISEPTVAPGGDQAANRRRPWPLLARWSVRAPSDDAAWAAYERSQNMPGDGLDRVATLVVREQWAQVIQSACAVDEPRGNLLVTAEVELLALYPFKRGIVERTETLTAGQTKTLTNAGTRAAPLTITTTGSGSVKVRQNASGQILQTRSGVTVATGTVFDCYAQEVTTSGGLETFPMGSPSEWLALPGGTVDTPQNTSVTNQGTAPLDLSWFDTY